MEFPKHIIATASLIQNKKGQVLLVKTKDRGWEIPGGAVEEGEDIISALKREVREEAGVKIEIQQLAACYSNISRNIVIFDFISEYIDNIFDATKANIDDDEIDEVGWFSQEDALSQITNESMLYRIKWLFEKNKTIRYSSYSRNPFKVFLESIV